MALEITTQIGTNKGITDKAYIRIVDYSFSKSGYANFRTELYQSKDDVSTEQFGPIGRNTAQNQQIGENFSVSLMKEIDVETEINALNINTNLGEIIKSTIKKQVPDLSIVADVNIFDFGYSELKKKLITLFGDNIKDC